MATLYDNNQFLRNYIKMREDKENFNDLIEQPKMFEILGDFVGKRILDIGCGYGSYSAKFADGGASEVYAFDVSENMIALAQKKNKRSSISYHVMDVNELAELNDHYDIAFSSLVMHYVEDLEKVFADIFRLLEDNGIFVFSMEHPIVTAGYSGGADLVNEEGIIEAYQLDHYNVPGLRCVRWLETDVVKYHHPISQIISFLIKCGFVIERLEEPLPDKDSLATSKRMRGELCRPTYLMFRCKKG